MYTTLQAVRRQVGVSTTDHDEHLAELIVIYSQAVEDWCGQPFEPHIDTYYFNGEVGIDNPTLSLHGIPLLTATTVKNGDGTEIAPAAYVLLPKHGYPKTDVRLAVGSYWVGPNGANGAPVDVAYAVDALEITGVWGFHRQYHKAWKATGLTLGAAVTNTTTTTITVQQATSLLDVGHLIQIDTEWMRVVGSVSESLTHEVERGVNGSTAATHSSGAAIYRYAIEPMIEQATRLWVAAAFKAEENPTGEVLNVSGMGTISTRDMPQKVKEKLVYPYWNWQTGQ